MPVVPEDRRNRHAAKLMPGYRERLRAPKAWDAERGEETCLPFSVLKKLTMFFNEKGGGSQRRKCNPLKLIDNSGFDENATTLSDEIEVWKKEIIAAGAEPFVTLEIDVEGYFATDEYICLGGNGIPAFELQAVKLKLAEDAQEACIASYVNGRVDLERKSGNIARLDYGKLSARAAKKANADPIAIMKGKKKLAKLRTIFLELYGTRFELQHHAGLPVDKELVVIAAKHFRDGSASDDWSSVRPAETASPSLALTPSPFFLPDLTHDNVLYHAQHY